MRDQFIKSFVRLKPIMLDQSPVVGFNKREIVVNKTKEIYSFNEVFNDSSQNDYIYEKSILPLMADLFNGYNACILAYGQTSSGKTYTMKGVSQNLGLIPLSIKEIFKRISNYKMFAKVSISYFQIYNENLIDLLSQDEQVRYLELREDGKKNLVVVDLIEQQVKDEFEALSFYEKGQMKRKFASNNVNFASSRSHTIFKIILSVVTQSHQLVESSIYMVDLAGSQSISKTNAVGVLKKESENINKSLLALTTAIRAISEKQVYVNYRNSKLTRILQPCLCGNSKTIVICTVKQTDECLSETLNTLKFGVCANSIRTDVKQNIIDVPLQVDQNSRYRSLIQILDQQRNEKAKIQNELNAKTMELQTNKLITANLAAELQQCKHKLFALQNQNSHHNGLIEYYKTQKEKELINKNIFYQKSQQSIALIQNENKNLKTTISNLNETIQKRNKKIAILQKNQRAILDKIQKYQKELSRLQEMLGQQQKKSKIRDSRKIVQSSLRNSSKNTDLVGNQTKNKKQKMTFYDIGRYSAPETDQLSHPFTIGTVISLSTTILSMKIDMNHYLNAITDLHTEIYSLQDKIDQLTKNNEEKNQLHRQSGRQRESGNRSKEDDKKIRKLEKRSQQLKKENQKLKKKNVHYLKILKKCANNNIESIAGFNEYIEKNFKFNQKALFEQLMQENAEDYEPYTSTDHENTKNNKMKENNYRQEGQQNSKYSQ